MLQLVAVVIGAGAGWLPHLLLGDRLSALADLVLGTAVGGVAYVYAIYRLKKLRGDF